MNKAFNDFLSSIASGASGDGGPNMKNYQHATKLYVDGNYARAPKVNHLYFIGFNINDGVVRDPSWLQSGINEVGLLVRSATLPKFKISTEQMNQYNRKTQVQTKLNYEPVTMEFHDDNSEITTGLWKNYYRYYYTDSIYGGKDDTVTPTPSQVTLGKKLFGGLLSPGRKRIKSLDSSTVPDAYTNNKYKLSTYPYGLDNLQTVPFFKSIDIFVLHQQKFTQYTLVNPKILSWDHDDVGQSDSTKLMRNKMTVIYENVLYNNGSIGKGSRSGIFAEAFYDTSPSPLSIAGKGSASLFGAGGVIGGIEDVFGENGALAQGNYLAAALQAATLIKNAGQITDQQLSAEGYSMLGAAVGTAVSSRNGEVIQNLQNNFGNSVGVYTNQFSKNNLENIPTAPVQVFDIDKYVATAPGTVARAEREAAIAQGLADIQAQAEERRQTRLEENASIISTEIYKVATDAEGVNAQRAANDESLQKSIGVVNQFSALIIPETTFRDPTYLQTTDAYKRAISFNFSEEGALQAATAAIVQQNAIAQTVVDQATRSRDSAAAYATVLDAHLESLGLVEENLRKNNIIIDGKVMIDNTEAYSGYQKSAKTYADAIAANTITDVGKSQIELQSKINAVIGSVLLNNVSLSNEQGKLKTELGAINDAENAAPAAMLAMQESVKAALAQGDAAYYEYNLKYYDSKNPGWEYTNLRTEQDFINKYGIEDGHDRFVTATNEAGKGWIDDFDKYEQLATEVSLNKRFLINKLLENSLAIDSNNIVANRTLIYGTNSVAASKLLDKMLEVAPVTDKSSPYIILTDSRTLKEAAADSASQTQPSATAVGSSTNMQIAVDNARSELRRKLALELYGDASKAFMIELINVNQPITQTTNDKGVVVYTATVTGSTPVAVRALTTDVTVTYRTPTGQVKTETVSYSQANNNYKTPAYAAAVTYSKYNEGQNKILGIVANTSNKVIRRY